MSAISDCLWKRKTGVNKEEHHVYYGCGHYLVKGKISLNKDEQHGILAMIKDGLIPKPQEAKCASCSMDALNKNDKNEPLLLL